MQRAAEAFFHYDHLLVKWILLLHGARIQPNMSLETTATLLLSVSAANTMLFNCSESPIITNVSAPQDINFGNSRNDGLGDFFVFCLVLERDFHQSPTTPRNMRSAYSESECASNTHAVAVQYAANEVVTTRLVAYVMRM